MGGSLTSMQVRNDNELIHHLASTKQDEVEETLSYYSMNHAGELTIDFELFDDIFGPLLNDSQAYFEILSQGQDNVDIFETIALTVLCCSANSHWKIQHLFQLFDFDNSNTIDYNELMMTIEAVTRGMCKLTGTPQPKKFQIAQFTQKVFKEVDKDGNGKLDMEEIVYWSDSCEEFQEILTKITAQINIHHSMSRYQRLTALYDKLFDDNSRLVGDENFIRQQIAVQILQKADPKLTDERLNLLLPLMVLPEYSVINEFSFKDTMRNWAAYEAVDYFELNQLTKNDLRFMVSCRTGYPISLDVVEALMKRIDPADSKIFTLSQWLLFSAYDVTVSSSTIFGFFLKQAVDQLGSPVVPLLDLGGVLSTVLKNGTAEKDESVTEINRLVETVLKDIRQSLSQETASWPEFKKCLKEAEEKFVSFKEFIVRNYTQCICFIKMSARLYQLPSEQEPSKAQARVRNFQESKMDPRRQRYGLFSFSGTLAVSDKPYDVSSPSKRDSEGHVITMPRNFATSPGKKGKTVTSFFSKPVGLEAVGDKYQDPGKTYLAEKLRAEKMRQVHNGASWKAGSSFKPSISSYPHVADYEYKQKKPKVDENGSVKISPRNILTSPPKKGHPASTPGTNFQSTIEYMSEPYDIRKELAIKERKQHMSKIEHPFKVGSPKKATFSDNKDVYGPVPMNSKLRSLSLPRNHQQHDKPWRRASPPMNDIVKKTISPFPEYVEDPLPTTARKPKSESVPWRVPAKHLTTPSNSIMSRTLRIELKRKHL